MDINAACSGFVYALDVVSAYIASNKARTVLLVSVDIMTRLADYADRNTCVLFGDGAAALVVTAGDQLKTIRLSSAGTDVLMNIPTHEGNSPYSVKHGRKPYLYMDGQEIYKWAVKALENEVRWAMGSAGYSMDKLAWLVPHQANYRILETAAKALGLDMGKVLSNIAECGNTVSACIPAMLCDAVSQGKIKQGDVVALCAFGGGLTTGVAVLSF
jgi:3-oxoacyl-[acyl-carrier-protein] synthase-3